LAEHRDPDVLANADNGFEDASLELKLRDMRMVRASLLRMKPSCENPCW